MTSPTPHLRRGAERPLWPGGVTADRLSTALVPLVASRRVELLQVPALGRHPVHDERYALIGEV